uniref:Uncharacterized protein n=1 Tax=viral metagenome TaxID=1070528 RepID=A0A6M3KP34_9ZZZZ
MNDESKIKTAVKNQDKIEVVDKQQETQLKSGATENVREPRRQRERVSLRKQRRLSIATEPGYHYHLVNDVDNRIERFKKAGYELVTGKVHDKGSNVEDPSQMGSVASHPVGKGVTGYYMRIPQEWYDQDQAEKQEENDRIMNQIKNGFSSRKPIDNMFGRVTVDDNIKRNK